MYCHLSDILATIIKQGLHKLNFGSKKSTKIKIIAPSFLPPSSLSHLSLVSLTDCTALSLLIIILVSSDVSL